MVTPPLYRANQLPLFQNRVFHCARAARECLRGDVVLAHDEATGLVSNREFRPELMIYDADYQNEQGLSSVFRAHLQNVSAIVRRHFQGLSLIEVGCGKGHFLETLRTMGFDVIGLDPAYEGSNPAIRKEYFTAQAGVRADGIILRHVLEHIHDPLSFLAKIRDANGGGGKIYIEVPCFDWICCRRAWFDIFYEHVNYFRLADFARIFDTVHEAGHAFNGQYLYAVADLASLRIPRAAQSPRVDFPSDFLATVERYATRLSAPGAPSSAVWGAGSKGVIFTLFMARAGAAVGRVIDINPAKQGKFLPVTGLRVESPCDAMKSLPADTEIFVMNGNYLDEIKDLTENRFRYTTVDRDHI
jgi:SAM-dependent methyltransferase